MNFITRLGNALRRIIPVDNSAPVVVILFVFVLLLALGIAFKGRRAIGAPVIQLSTGSSVLRGPAPVLGLSFDYPSGRGGDVWRSQLLLVGHSDFRGVAYPNSYMAGEQYVTGFGGFDVGLGLAYLANPLPFNGVHMNFNLSLGFRFAFPVAIAYEHFSCAGSCSPNLGRDVVLVGWRFR